MTIRAAREVLNRQNSEKGVNGELWVAFQSHTHSRTKALLNEFAEALALADHALVADIRDDREADDGTISGQDIVDKVVERGTDALYLRDFATIEKFIQEHAKNNDVLITLGSGPIYSIGESLLRD